MNLENLSSYHFTTIFESVDRLTDGHSNYSSPHIP